MKNTFEDKMNRISQIVSELEGGELSLEDSLLLFEEGTSLINDCTKTLKNAEQKVAKIKKGNDGSPVEVPFV